MPHNPSRPSPASKQLGKSFHDSFFLGLSFVICKMREEGQSVCKIPLKSHIPLFPQFWIIYFPPTPCTSFFPSHCFEFFLCAYIWGLLGILFNRLLSGFTGSLFWFWGQLLSTHLPSITSLQPNKTYCTHHHFLGLVWGSKNSKSTFPTSWHLVCVSQHSKSQINYNLRDPLGKPVTLSLLSFHFQAFHLWTGM
jgi:hypothetical protein